MPSPSTCTPACARKQAGNLFCSPQSIATALAMTSLGARGETATEMARTLHLSMPQAELPAAYAAFLATLRAKDQPWELSVANRLWGERGATFLAPFLEAVRTGFDAELGRVDFATQPDAAREEINRWVERETRDKIRNLLAPGTVTPLTRLVLTNAIYFRADWAEQFDRAATSDQPFTVPGSAPRTVPLMFRKVKAGYAELPDARAKLLELPYRGDALSMIVLLPDAKDGLGALEEQLTAERLDGWIGTATHARRAGVPAAVHGGLALRPGRHAGGDGHAVGVRRRAGRLLRHERHARPVRLGGRARGARRGRRARHRGGGRHRRGGGLGALPQEPRCSAPTIRSCSRSATGVPARPFPGAAGRPGA